MTFLVERLSELRKLFSFLTVRQLVIDIAGELSARRGLAFDDYTQAVRNLGRLDLVDDATLLELDAMPGFRNVLVHEYVTFFSNAHVIRLSPPQHSCPRAPSRRGADPH